MMTGPTDDGTVSEAFAVTNRVKQGHVLAPSLFSLIFSTMSMDAHRDKRPGIRIVYWTDRNLLNSQRMQASTWLSTITIYDLLFVDDCALNTVSEADIQRSMNLFASGCTNFELTINTNKRVVMYQPPPNAAYAVPLIHVNSTELEIVDNSAYLGSTLSSYIKINEEVAH
ncbi:hypothetical protein SprV_0200872500 [Sparganum proliferum]